jgi:hypothetical protein
MDRRSFLLASTGALALTGCVERGRNARPGANRSVTRTRASGGSTSARPLTRTAEPNGSSNTGESVDRSTDEPAATTATPTDRADEPVQRRVSPAGADDTEREHDLRIEVDLLEATVTPAYTARVRVRTTNEGPERRLSIGEDGCSLFNRDGGASDPPGVYLYPPDSAKWLDRAGNRWTADADPGDPRAWAAYGCLSLGYAPGESVTNEYFVWDDYRVDGYLRPGTYRFEEPVRVLPPDGPTTSTPDREPIAEFDWGFELTITNPETY